MTCYPWVGQVHTGDVWSNVKHYNPADNWYAAEWYFFSIDLIDDSHIRATVNWYLLLANGMIFQPRDWALPLAVRGGYVTEDKIISIQQLWGIMNYQMTIKWLPLISECCLLSQKDPLSSTIDHRRWLWWFCTIQCADITGDHFKFFWYGIISKWLDPCLSFNVALNVDVLWILDDGINVRLCRLLDRLSWRS